MSEVEPRTEPLAFQEVAVVVPQFTNPETYNSYVGDTHNAGKLLESGALTSNAIAAIRKADPSTIFYFEAEGPAGKRIIQMRPGQDGRLILSRLNVATGEVETLGPVVESRLNLTIRKVADIPHSEQDKSLPINAKGLELMYQETAHYKPGTVQRVLLRSKATILDKDAVAKLPASQMAKEYAYPRAARPAQGYKSL